MHTRLAACAIALAACTHASAPPASTPPAPTAPAPSATAEVPISDPAEYHLDRASRDAGETIFTRTGIGDPYRTGVPYPIFLALLRSYPDLFGADTTALAKRFGFVARAPDPKSDDLDVREGLPVGMHLTVDPFTSVPFVVTSCTLCHAERLRWPGGEALVIGLGNKRVRVHEYDAAFAEAARRSDFNEIRISELADDIAEQRKVAWPVEWRTPLVRATADALRERASTRADFLAKVKDGPPGRVAVLEAFALAIGSAIHRNIATAPTVGWAKIPDVVGFPQRVSLSWDGVAEGPMDILIVEADFAAGVRTEWFWAHPLQGASLNAYLRQARDPLPFPGKIDRGLAERGRELFEDNCSQCHGSYAADGRSQRYDEQVVPLDIIGTDPARADAASDDFIAGANDERLTRGLVHSKRTGGYVPPILTDVWARAPYGHIGQWPSLAVMATPPERRPARIVLDFDAPYDLQEVGIPTRAPDTKPLRPGEYLHDGSRPGLGVGGHPFLADLGKDARAVIEYLKTL